MSNKEAVLQEYTRITISHHHGSYSEVLRVVASFLKRRMSLCPFFQPKSEFVLTCISDFPHEDNVQLLNNILTATNPYIKTELHSLPRKALAEDQFDVVKSEAGITPRQVLGQSDVVIFIECGINPDNVSRYVKTKQHCVIDVVYV